MSAAATNTRAALKAALRAAPGAARQQHPAAGFGRRGHAQQGQRQARARHAPARASAASRSADKSAQARRDG